jgi:hypothetical protein
VQLAAKTLLAALFAVTALASAAAAASLDCPPTGMVLIRDLPVTRAYRIQPDFCPRQLVALIPQWFPGSGECSGCGPYGVPPIYASGSWVVIRQTRSTHEQIAHYLVELGAVMPTKGTR